MFNGGSTRRAPLCSAVTQLSRHASRLNTKHPAVRASSQYSQAEGNLPLTLSPVLPALTDGQGLGESGFVTPMKPLFAARRREAGVAAARSHVTIKRHREENTRKSPNSPPNALYW